MRVEKATWFKGTYEKLSSKFVHDARLTAVEQTLALRLFGRDSGHYPELTPEGAIALLHPEDQPGGQAAWHGLVDKGYLFYADGDWHLVDPELDHVIRKFEPQAKDSERIIPKMWLSNGHADGGGSNGQVKDLEEETQLPDRSSGPGPGPMPQALDHFKVRIKAVKDDLQLTDYQRHRQMEALIRELKGVDLPPYPVVDLPEIDRGHVMYKGTYGRLGWGCILADRHEWRLWGPVMVCAHCNLHHRECRCPGEHCRAADLL